MWRKYDEATIALPAVRLPPVHAPNISLNDQIFQGDHNFCPDGTNYSHDCPSARRALSARVLKTHVLRRVRPRSHCRAPLRLPTAALALQRHHC